VGATSVGVSTGVTVVAFVSVVDSVAVSLLLQPMTNKDKTATRAKNKFFMLNS